MRICARNADPTSPIPEINRELSALADAAVGATLDIVYDILAERTGPGTPAHNLVVMGLGKLGGDELNVSSDIDLIYLCAERDTRYGTHDTMSFHTMLAERLTRTLSEVTDLGFLYRVDTRLRADGASGPLVRTVQDYLRYLEMRGEAWERQMLLKARPVAGDIALGEVFLASVERFIFPTSLTRSPNREIVEIKNRIEARMVAEGSKKTHLKLVPGGVRDIEFITQCLQLLMGGANPGVRAQGTLTALERLHSHGALSDDEYTTLSESYQLYRRVENALQWRELLPAFSLPDEEDDLALLAAQIGYQGNDSGDAAGALSRELRTRLGNVRRVFEAVFSSGNHESFDETVIYAARNPACDDRTRRFMESLGFSDPDGAARSLARLAFGEESELPDSSVHPAAVRFLPVLIKELSGLPDPGGTLERFVRIAEAYRARHMLFDILAGNRRFFDLVIAVCQGSLFIADIITGDPSLLDWLVEEGGIVSRPDAREIDRELREFARKNIGDESFSRACLAVKNREKIRIGARDISGLSGTKETFFELSTVAEAIVRAVCERASADMTSSSLLPKGFPFSIIAAGRLGTKMMDFGSDLDLIFVYREPTRHPDDFNPQERAAGLARRILALLTGGGGPLKVYDVDARLRPEGGNSPLAVSLEEYRRYLDNRASSWERLALMRARYVAGEKRLGAEVSDTIRSFVYRAPLTKREIDRIFEIRATMIEESRKRHPGAVNVKSGAGGLTDIDFMAQTYSAHYGAAYETLRKRETPAILDALAGEKLLAPNDAASLKELYAFLCDVEKTLRIGSGRSINTIPPSETETARVSRLLGFRNTRRFRKRLDDATGLTLDLCGRLMRELRDRAPDDTAA